MRLFQEPKVSYWPKAAHKRYLKQRSKDQTPTISDEGLLFWWAQEDLNLELGNFNCLIPQALLKVTLRKQIQGDECQIKPSGH